MRRLPLFTWINFVNAFIIIFALPVLNAALAMILVRNPVHAALFLVLLLTGHLHSGQLYVLLAILALCAYATRSFHYFENDVLLAWAAGELAEPAPAVVDEESNGVRRDQRREHLGRAGDVASAAHIEALLEWFGIEMVTVPMHDDGGRRGVHQVHRRWDRRCRIRAS